jgi:putative phage-type endonuclease
MTITAEQRAARQYSIGGSDAPVIAGVSPYATPLSLWLEKLNGPGDDTSTLPMRVGNALENLIIDEWGRETGKSVVPVMQTIPDGELSFITAHIDGRVSGEHEGIEAKSVGFAGDEWGPSETDIVPPHVFIQCSHYMMVTGWQRWHVGAIFGGREFRHYTLERNDSIIRRLREMEIEFWSNVTNNIAPPMMTPQDARLLFTRDDGSAIVATPDVADLCSRLAHVRSEKESYAKLEDELKAKVQSFMGEARTLKSPTGETLATWARSKDSYRIDLDGLRANAPKIAAQFTVPKSGSRRFILK